MKLSPVGEIIASLHLGDPANVSDSWRAGRRRDRLYAKCPDEIGGLPIVGWLTPDGDGCVLIILKNLPMQNCRQRDGYLVWCSDRRCQLIPLHW